MCFKLNQIHKSSSESALSMLQLYTDKLHNLNTVSLRDARIII